jgi:Flp pilus assembly protein TadG
MKSKFRFLSLLSRLGKDNHASGPRLLARLLRDEDGLYLIYGWAMLPVLLGVAGLATEGGLLFYNHRTLQSAADGAAYSAAIAYSYDTSADITTQAKAIVASYGFDLGTGNNQANVSATSTTFATKPAIQVTISRPQTAIFSSFYGFPSLSNSVSATAVLSSSNSGNCLLALGNTATGNDAPNAIALQGSPTINLGGCGVFSNSADCANGAVAVALGGNAALYAGSVGAAGCISVTGSSNIGPPPKAYTQNDGALSDPYGTISIPTTSSAGACTATTSVPSTGKNAGVVAGDGTLCPGVYSAGMSVKNNTVTLQPGIYILKGNSTTPALEVQNGTVNGNGVTLVFTSADGTYPAPPSNLMMNIHSNATLNVTAPTTGPTAGIVIMGDRTMPYGTEFDIWANAGTNNSTVSINGTVYLPNGYLAWGGTPTTALGCRQFIVNTITMGGNPGLNASGCNLTAGQKPIGSIVTLVQ